MFGKTAISQTHTAFPLPPINAKQVRAAHPETSFFCIYTQVAPLPLHVCCILPKWPCTCPCSAALLSYPQFTEVHQLSDLGLPGAVNPLWIHKTPGATEELLIILFQLWVWAKALKPKINFTEIKEQQEGLRCGQDRHLLSPWPQILFRNIPGLCYSSNVF